MSNGARTAGDWYWGHLVTSTTRASVETGAIVEDELARFIFGTAHKEDFLIGRQLLVNGEFWQIVGPVEVQNAVAALQRAEVAVQRIKT